tara:strand:- start:113 stop:718 length:606 start_codon:yes stop_codon:yes gene_type:complete
MQSMINFINISSTKPYKIFRNYYSKALLNNQKSIEAIAISSFNKTTNEVESRFVNLKYINNQDWIFFSDYNSRKAQDFVTHDQISALFFWKSINVQIRLKAYLKKTDKKFSDTHFAKRSLKKNALAISSNQSKFINSYQEVYENFNHTLNNKDLSLRPDDWGGYSFVPYYFEFWEGHESRINKRVVYQIKNNEWNQYFLQP